jgi:Arm DNA-binding domain
MAFRIIQRGCKVQDNAAICPMVLWVEPGTGGMKLTALDVRRLTAPGLHSDGNSLYLQIVGKSKTWIYRYQRNGRARTMGLGPVYAVSLADARALVRHARVLLQRGVDPIEDRKERRTAASQGTITQRTRAFAKTGIESKCSLYRHYDVDGNLLYVGISLEPLRRQQKHMDTVDWRTAIFQIVIEPFATREDAIEAEESAIRNEHPKYNTTHNKYRKFENELKYLVATAGAALDSKP